MKKLASNLSLAGAVLAGALATTAVARAADQDLSMFDASRADSPAEKLVLCDTTAFLRTRPDLDSTRMFARRDGQPFQLLIGPYFVQGGTLYSQRYDRLFWRLQHKGQATSRQVIDAQATIGRQMVRGYRQSRWVSNRFASQQQTYCSGFARQNGVNEPE